MKRRRILTGISSAVGLSMAGCIEETPSQTTISDISSISIDSSENELISYTVDFITRSSSSSEPIGFTISVTNTGETQLTISDATALLFEYTTDSNQEFLLLPESYTDASYTNDCWSVNITELNADREPVIRIDPGETVSRDVYLVSYTGCVFESFDQLRFTETTFIHTSPSLSDGQDVQLELQIT